jgi:hypothetical protein
MTHGTTRKREVGELTLAGKQAHFKGLTAHAGLLDTLEVIAKALNPQQRELMDCVQPRTAVLLDRLAATVERHGTDGHGSNAGGSQEDA